MTTTATAQPSIHHARRRTLLSVAFAAALAVGAGAAAVRLTSSDGTTSRQTKPAAVTVPSTADIDALWNYLAQLPTAERDQVLVALVPDPTGALGAIGAGRVTPDGG